MHRKNWSVLVSVPRSLTACPRCRSLGKESEVQAASPLELSKPWKLHCECGHEFQAWIFPQHIEAPDRLCVKCRSCYAITPGGWCTTCADTTQYQRQPVAALQGAVQ